MIGACRKLTPDAALYIIVLAIGRIIVLMGRLTL